MALEGYSDHSREGKYIKLELSSLALCKAISIADRFSLTGSSVIQSLKDGCFIKVLYSSSTLQPMWSKTKCIKALWNRAAPKHGSLNDFSHIVMIKWWTVTDYNQTTTRTWSPYLVASSALLLEMSISPYPPAANVFWRLNSISQR